MQLRCDVALYPDTDPDHYLMHNKWVCALTTRDLTCCWEMGDTPEEAIEKWKQKYARTAEQLQCPLDQVEFVVDRENKWQ